MAIQVILCLLNFSFCFLQSDAGALNYFEVLKRPVRMAGANASPELVKKPQVVRQDDFLVLSNALEIPLIMLDTPSTEEFYSSLRKILNDKNIPKANWMRSGSEPAKVDSDNAIR